MLQITRSFSWISYQSLDSNGDKVLVKVPVKTALTNKQVAAAINNNSSNIMNVVPVISCNLQSIEIANERRQSPYYLDKTQVYEREFSEDHQVYTNRLGSRWQVDRPMPVPYNFTYRVDVWTSNQLQKEQILEQILILFNPSIDIQKNVNPMDWTSLGLVMIEGIEYSNRTIPIGTSDDIDVFSLTFKVEGWLTPPAYLHQSKVILEIITNIGELESMEAKGQLEGWDMYISPTDTLARVITTPGNFNVEVNGNMIKLLTQHGLEIDDDGIPMNWKNLIDLMGGPGYRPNISQFRLKIYDDLDNPDRDIIGTFEYTQEENLIKWSLDPLSMPQPNLQQIDGIIDPRKRFPGSGIPLPSIGTRYLLIDEIVKGEVWGPDLAANPNDIIEYTSNGWKLSFDSDKEQDEYFLINSKTGRTLRWNSESWTDLLSGIWKQGFWRIFL